MRDSVYGLVNSVRPLNALSGNDGVDRIPYTELQNIAATIEPMDLMNLTLFIIRLAGYLSV